MTLISDPRTHFSDRDYSRWAGILNTHAEVERKARNARNALAAELGFDSLHPRSVQTGDKIRLRSGLWAEVIDRKYRTDEATGQQFFVFLFADCSPLTIEDSSDHTPIEPQRLIVEVPEQDEPF